MRTTKTFGIQADKTGILLFVTTHATASLTKIKKLGWIDLLLISIPLTVIALFNLFVY